jgi:hypothetical protein
MKMGHGMYHVCQRDHSNSSSASPLFAFNVSPTTALHGRNTGFFTELPRKKCGAVITAEFCNFTDGLATVF